MIVFGFGVVHLLDIVLQIEFELHHLI